MKKTKIDNKAQHFYDCYDAIICRINDLFLLPYEAIQKLGRELEKGMHDHYIAIYESFNNEYNNTQVITEKQYIKKNINLNSMADQGFCRCRFNFCPVCGAVINWDNLKKLQKIENKVRENEDSA